MPKISVIVPVYNVEKHLDKCLGSILSQTFTDFELLLINDGSLDNSGKICDEYAENDDRIRVFHKKNGGVSSARNLGLDNAQGEWIAFIDSDDWVEKTYLEHLFINNDKYEFSVMGYIDQWKISIDNKPEYDVFINKNFIKFYEQYITTPLEGCVWGCLLSLAIINKIQLRFDENLSFGEDNLFLSDYFENISTIQVINYSDYHKTFDKVAPLIERNMPITKITYSELHEDFEELTKFKMQNNQIRDKQTIIFVTMQQICLVQRIKKFLNS